MRIILALMVLVAALQQRAEACSCRPTTFVPTLVPLNARIPVLGPVDQLGVVLSTADGRVVPSTTESIGSGFAVVPSVPLAPDTDYVLNDSAGLLSAPFRTRLIDDEAAPPSPVLGAVSHFVPPIFRSTCLREGEAFSVAVSDPESAEVIYEVFTGSTVASIDSSEPTLVVPAIGAITLDDASTCGWNFAVSKTPALAVAIRSRDFAGNVSELSNAVQLKGCSASGGPALMVLAGLLTRIWAKSRRKRAVP
jgi:hypothetical protein